MALRPKEEGPAEFKTEGLILCEGIEDAAVIRQLIKVRALGIDVEVRANSDMHRKAHGDGAFARAVSAADANRGFRGVKRVLIIADSDDEPAKKLLAVRQQIEKARTAPELGLQRPWPNPTHSEKFTNGSPAVGIWMWPGASVKGCLESVLWPAIKAKYPGAADCVEKALDCSGVNASWSLSKRDKAAVRCFFSVACEKNPGATLSTIFNDSETTSYVPLDHQNLDPIANFLKQNF